MKIIKHYAQKPVRRSTILIDIPKPKKKALLIGISYDASNKGLFGKLSGPLKDVEDMKNLLIKTYEYDPKDVVVLTDSPGSDIFPTRAVILEQVKKLVEGAVPGDHFFFHYSGHATQIPNKTRSEEDGMDECLVPVDETVITDNELRRLLVDNLPVGSSLIAVFDSCHSESLLDLEHYRCNRVYVPWVSKGRRRSDSLRTSNVRQKAIDVQVSSKTIYQNRRVSAKSVTSRKTSIDQLVNTNTKAERIYITTKSLSLKSAWLDDDKLLPIQRCESPVAMFPCDGLCRDREEIQAVHGDADVISLSSCKDSQVAYETADGESMTKALVRTLNKDPHPTFKELLINLSHRVYNGVYNIHTDNRSYKRRLKAWATQHTSRKPKQDPGPLDTVNFQDPQLASHRPLVHKAGYLGLLECTDIPSGYGTPMESMTPRRVYY